MEQSWEKIGQDLAQDILTLDNEVRVICGILPAVVTILEAHQYKGKDVLKAPRFDGTFKRYQRFKQDWASYEDKMLTDWSPAEIELKFKTHGLCKTALSHVEDVDTMEAIWRHLDLKYLHPSRAALEILDPVLNMKRLKDGDRGGHLFYYRSLLRAGGQAMANGLEFMMMDPIKVNEMADLISPEETEKWTEYAEKYQPRVRPKSWMSFVEARAKWHNLQSGGKYEGRSPEKRVLTGKARKMQRFCPTPETIVKPPTPSGRGGARPGRPVTNLKPVTPLVNKPPVGKTSGGGVEKKPEETPGQVCTCNNIIIFMNF